MFLLFQVVMKQNAAIEHLKQKKTMTPAEREENQRCVCCHEKARWLTLVRLSSPSD